MKAPYSLCPTCKKYLGAEAVAAIRNHKDTIVCEGCGYTIKIVRRKPA